MFIDHTDISDQKKRMQRKFVIDATTCAKNALIGVHETPRAIKKGLRNVPCSTVKTILNRSDDNKSITKFKVIAKTDCAKSKLRGVLEEFLKKKHLNRSVKVVSTGSSAFQLRIMEKMVDNNQKKEAVEYIIDLSSVSNHAIASELKELNEYIATRLESKDIEAEVTTNDEMQIKVGCPTFFRKRILRMIVHNYLKKKKYSNDELKISATEEDAKTYKVLLRSN